MFEKIDKTTTTYRLKSVSVFEENQEERVCYNIKHEEFEINYIFRLFHEDGKYKLHETNGEVDTITFVNTINCEDIVEMGPNNFIDLGRPIKFQRTIEEITIETI